MGRAMTWDPATQRMEKNAAGVAFYHSLIDTILTMGLEPVVTVFHWDTPTQLASYGDFANASIVEHFVEYADLVFSEFGSKVKYWGTINEPMSYTISFFYDQNPANEYQVAHHLLLSHAGAVERFRARRSEGSVRADARIGLVMSGYGVPMDASNQDDVDASERLIKSYLGWWLGPLTTGDYPPLMRQRVGDRLPVFTPAQSALLKGSYDLLMPNFYYAHAVTNCDSPRSSTKCSDLKPGWETDVGVDYSQHSNLPGVRVGTSSCAAFSGYAPHYLEFIEWIHAQDPSVDILLTENGWCGSDTIENTDQTWYIRTHLEQVHTAIFEKHIPIIGYMVWSFMDNWEWGSFESRFGLYHVAYPPGHGKPDDNAVDPSSLTRTPRHAARFLSGVAKSGCLTIEPEDVQFLP